MLGIIPNTSRRAATTVSSPLEKLASYQGLTLPLSQVLPPLQQNGRSDPIAVLGRGINSKNNKKKLVKAQKKMQKGRSSEVESLEAGLKWVSVLFHSRSTTCLIKFPVLFQIYSWWSVWLTLVIAHSEAEQCQCTLLNVT